MGYEQEREHHDSFYKNDVQRFETPMFRAVRSRVVSQIRRVLTASSHERILSLGSGDGFYELELAPLAREIVGMELSGVGVEIAQRAAERRNITNVRFIRANINEINSHNIGEQFDIVIAIACLHHLNGCEIKHLMANCVNRIIKKGGLFLSHDPSVMRLVGLFKPLASTAIAKFHTAEEHELSPAPGSDKLPTRPDSKTSGLNSRISHVVLLPGCVRRFPRFSPHRSLRSTPSCSDRPALTC